MNNQTREDFEKFATGPEFELTQAHLEKHDNGEYVNFPTQCYWLVWQAASSEVERLRQGLRDIVTAERNSSPTATDFGISWDRGILIGTMKDTARNALQAKQ